MEQRSTTKGTVKVTHWVRRDIREAAERKAKAAMKKTGKPVYAQRFLSEYTSAAKDIEFAQSDEEVVAIVERLRGKPLSLPVVTP